MLAFAQAHWPQIAAGVVVLIVALKMAAGAGLFAGIKWPWGKSEPAAVPLKSDLDSLLGILARAKKRTSLGSMELVNHQARTTYDAVAVAVESLVKEVTA